MNFLGLNRLLAAAALGLELLLSSHPSAAQQSAPGKMKIETRAPMRGKATPAYTVAQSGTQSKSYAATLSTKPARATVAPAPTPSPPSIDTQVSDALRNLINGRRLDYYVSRKEDREDVERFYREHDYKPIWTNDGKANARANATIAFLGQVETDGLVPSDYPTPDFATPATPDGLADAELHLTNSVLRYARDAQIGRIHFSRIGSDISFKLVPPEPTAVLANVSEATDVAKTLDAYNPPQAGFQALKKKLAELRSHHRQIAMAADKPALVRIPEGKILRLGMKDPRVIALRKRLNVAGDMNNPLYDENVADAVKAFQTAADVNADGLLGPITMRALNRTSREAHRAPTNPTDTIIVNMERWRWLPRNLGNDANTYVMVNVPDYTLKL